MSPRRAVVLCLAVGWGIGATPCARADEPILEQFWITNGEVRAIEEADGQVYLGGDFSAVGPAIGAAARFDLATGEAQTPHLRADGSVRAIVPDGSGGYYLGGDFNAVRGQPRGRAARIDAAGEVLPWDPQVVGSVRAIAVSGSTVFLGGDISSVGGQPRTGLAAVDAGTGAVLPWAPFLDSPGQVNVLLASATTLYVGGPFSRVDFITRNAIAAFDLASLVLTSFYAPSSSSGVNAFALRGNTLYVGGDFRSIGGATRLGLAALDATTGALQAWAPAVNTPTTFRSIHTIATSQRNSFPFEITVWVGGSFFSVGTELRANVAAIDGSTGLPTTWNPGANGTVHGLVMRLNGLTGLPTAIYAGGEFTSFGGATRSYLAAVSAAGSATAWFPEPDGPVRTLLYGADGIHAGGDFRSATLTPRSHLAALDATTGAVTPWNPGADGPVNALVHSGGALYAGGAFGFAGGALRAGLAKLDPVSGLATSWNAVLACPTLSCAAPVVRAITPRTDGSSVFVGGEFETAGGLARHNLAALDTGTAAPLAFNVNVNGAVRALALREPLNFPFAVTLFAAGAFTTVHGGLFGYGPGGLARYGLAALDGDTGEATPWNPSRASWAGVNAVRYTPNGGGVLGPGTVWVGGRFSEVGPYPTPTARTNAAAFDAANAEPTPWSPAPDGEVRALLVARGKGYLGGDFANVGGVPRARIASVDLAAGAPTSWSPDAAGTSSVLALESSQDTVYAGGSFPAISHTPHRYFAAIADPADTDGDGIPDTLDNCPFWASPDLTDTDADGRGDVCECTDQDGDGRNTVTDLVAINVAIFNPALATPLCDGNGDGLCNVNDVVAANVEIFSPTNTSICARQPVPGP